MSCLYVLLILPSRLYVQETVRGMWSTTSEQGMDGYDDATGASHYREKLVNKSTLLSYFALYLVQQISTVDNDHDGRSNRMVIDRIGPTGVYSVTP